MKSKSGRELIQPKFKGDVQKHIKILVLWLIENAKTEATPYERILIDAISPNKKGEISQSDYDTLNLILFDKINTKIDGL